MTVFGRVKLERVSDHTRSVVLARYCAKQAVKEQWRRQGLRPHQVAASLLHQAAEAYLDQHREELITKACAALTTFARNRKR